MLLLQIPVVYYLIKFKLDSDCGPLMFCLRTQDAVFRLIADAMKGGLLEPEIWPVRSRQVRFHKRTMGVDKRLTR